MTLAGIETATFRFLVQHLNHCVFYVLLTLHLSIISVINQLNAQILVL